MLEVSTILGKLQLHRLRRQCEGGVHSGCRKDRQTEKEEDAMRDFQQRYPPKAVPVHSFIDALLDDTNCQKRVNIYTESPTSL